jgi:Flp pilus assembly protein TadG
MIRRIEKRKRKGVVMIMFTMMMLFIILPAVGLAVDAGVMFAIKAKMQSAADGAGLAAARSLSRGMTFESQQASAAATAKKFYRINIENGWLGLNSAADPVVTFPTVALNTMSIHVDVNVSAPTYFMRILGPSSVTLKSRAEINRRFVNLALVLDRSGSLANSGSCTGLKSAATDFTNMFVNGTDQLSLVTFGTTYRTDFTLASDFLSRAGGNDIPSLIGGINCAGGTNAASGYMTGGNALIAANQPGALNVVVFFTDGMPTAVHLPAIPMIGGSSPGCADTSARDGVVTYGGSTVYGVVTPIEPHAPGSVVASDWQQALNTPSNSGCKWATDTAKLNQDTARLTGTGSTNWKDKFGNSLTGSASVSMGGSSPNQYVTLSATNVDGMAENALVSAADRIRSLSVANGTNVLAYVIGLGNYTSPPDTTLLKRIANTSDSTYYNSAYAPGDMIYATNNDELHAAFARLASEILRITM